MSRGGGRPKPSQDAKLRAIYAQVPSTNCKGLCVEHCNSIGMTPQEQQRIRVRTGLNLPRFGAFGTHDDPDALCPALTSGRCSIYNDRPLICRLWGATDSMPCEHGCVPDGGRLTAAAGADLAVAAQRLAGVDPQQEGQRAAASVLRSRQQQNGLGNLP